MQKTYFFSLRELKQPVNQWICIAFLGVWVFWFMLYYVVGQTQALGDNYVSVRTSTAHLK